MEDFFNIFALNPEKKSTINLNEYALNPVPLSLIAFKGGDVVSGMIRALQKWYIGFDEFSHVGLLITKDCCPFINELEKGRIYVWESTISYTPLGIGDGVLDVVSKEKRFGVQIRDLEELYPKYTSDKAKIALCELTSNPWSVMPGDSKEKIQKRRKKIINILYRVYKKYKDARYEFNPIQLGASIFPCMRGLEKGLNSVMVNGVPTLTNKMGLNRDDQVFCSEFVAIVYKKLGVIPSNVDTFRVVPGDFFGMDADKENGIPYRVVNTPIYFVTF